MIAGAYFKRPFFVDCKTLVPEHFVNQVYLSSTKRGGISLTNIHSLDTADNLALSPWLSSACKSGPAHITWALVESPRSGGIMCRCPREMRSCDPPRMFSIDGLRDVRRARTSVRLVSSRDITPSVRCSRWGLMTIESSRPVIGGCVRSRAVVNVEIEERKPGWWPYTTKLLEMVVNICLEAELPAAKI